MVTPVKVGKLESLLNRTEYPHQEMVFLCDGFRNGFDIGYEGPQHRRSCASNLPLSVGNETILWNKLIKEVKLGRVAGPFEDIPFQNYIQSPIGLVPKAGGDETRLIFHLSYDFKKQDGLKSLNHFTPKEKCTVKYKDLDFAVQAYLRLFEEIVAESEESESLQKQRRWQNSFDKKSHKWCKPVIFTGKSDIKSVFRILGLSPESWKWLIMKARDPVTQQWLFFVDKCLPFGASISCALFQKFSDALCHIVEKMVRVHNRITNYLNDFLFIARTIALCNAMINRFLEICQEIGVPVAMEKTEWAAEFITFLGILLDGRNRILAIPLEKKDNAIDILMKMLDKKKATVHELQRLCGILNFIGRTVFPGRTFT